MASSSTSPVHKSFKYDVFLSFRGEDTRKTFVDHLYYALQQKSIHTYKDDERIKKGKKIRDELIESIKDSRFHVIVFSKNYASSSWCLEELVQIMECQKTAEQTAYPVFYDVEPSEVCKQNGEFGEVFARHEKEEAAEKWREALEEAAGLAGWELKNTLDGHEAKFIQRIVEKISLELRSINFNIDGKLIGMETRIKDVCSSLETGFDDVRVTGIKGIGGGGKTTLARAIFDQISIQFEGKSFVENVREVSTASLSGLKKLQKQVLQDVLIDQDIKLSNVHEGKKMMKKVMCCRKILLVLDDVDHIEQLEALAGELNWFKEGSVIIITTRDEQVLLAHRVNLICDINLLSQEEAICLFSRYAFGREIPIPGHEELSRQVVEYAAGLPLTIKVLGSFLCGKNDLEWTDALERLKTIPLKETLEKLELSYNGLEEDHKEIFLDVACILKDFPRYIAIQMLESCGFHARTALRVLEQKSLITILKNGCLGMHDHVEEMGKNIVRRLHPDEPKRHSRLWIYEEIKDILANNLGDETTRCIKLQMGEVNAEIIMKGLGNMKKLRFLYVFCQNNAFYGDWIFDKVSAYFPNALRFLFWDGYPFGYLPNTFQANNLVELEMPSSKIEQLWEGGERKVLDKLRFLKLDHSELKTIDLGITPNLEMLDLRRCYDLVELHMPAETPKLKYINLSHAKLRTLDLRLTPNLETLILEGCKDLGDMPLPVRCPKLKSFDFSYSKLRTFDLQKTPNLEILDLGGCHDLVELYMLVGCLKLKYLNLSHSKLRNLNLELTPNLETLMLEGCNGLVEHRLLVGCPQLRYLNLGYSKLKTLDLRLALNLERLHLGGCHNLRELHMPVGCQNLESIDIKVSKLRTLDLGGISNLKSLSLVECVGLVELHLPVECLKLISLELMLSKLRTLDLRGTPNLENLHLEKCDDLVVFNMPNERLKLRYLTLSLSKLRTIDLGGTPNLKTLSLTESYHSVELQALVGCLENLSHLSLNGCLRFEIDFRRELESLNFGSSYMLRLRVISRGICSLHHDKCLPKFQFECFVKHHEPSSIGNLQKFISLGLCACTNPKGAFVLREWIGMEWISKRDLDLEGF